MNLVKRPPAEQPALVDPGAFTVGSILRHVLVMTGTGSIGLIAVFLVEFLTLLYISRLGDTNLTAAVGFAAQITFLLLAANIGLTIAIGALVSRAVGAGRRDEARRLAASGVTLVALVSGGLGLAMMPFTRLILQVVGASGEALEVGSVYLWLVLPGMVMLGLGMGLSALLRAIGDPRRAMGVTLSGALVTACLDPILILVLHLGIYGAGITVLVSRLVIMLVGLHGAVRVHDLVARPRLAALRGDLAPFFAIAGPVVLTSLANPVANIYAIRIFSHFGGAVVAAFVIMDRVSPVAFGMLFALSGCIGPIIGQNFGARLFPRVRAVLRNSYGIAAAYVVAVGLVLFLAAPLVVTMFDAKGETAQLLAFFCRLAGVMWVFVGGTFVANAGFNNLGWPLASTVVNWGRAMLGTIPLVTLGASWGGPEGAYLGIIAGTVLFGVLAVAGSIRFVDRLGRSTAQDTP